MTDVPKAATFTPAPLRNRLRVALHAPVGDVWALIGDLARFPEYSRGLARVDAQTDSSGAYVEYVCRFKPQQEGGESIVSRERIRWWEANRGYASSGAATDAFGLANDLHMVTVEPGKDGTIVTWEDISMHAIPAYEGALRRSARRHRRKPRPPLRGAHRRTLHRRLTKKGT
jgi:hypothetical protein